MEFSIPFKKKITSRGYSVNYGGDGRYRYDLCPRARTVVVTDMNLHVGTFTPLSLATTARVATINLTAGYSYHNICFRSRAQQVYVFGTQNVIVIDADPNSVNFNTIVNTITTGVFNLTNSVVYSEAYDVFITMQVKVNAGDLTTSSLPIRPSTTNSYYSSTTCYFQQMAASAIGSVNGEVFGLQSHKDDSVFFLGLSSNVTPYKVAGKYYTGVGNQFFRLDSAGVRESLISITSTARGDGSYSPLSKHIVLTHYNGTSIPILSISPTFVSVGNLYTLITSILATNHASTNSVTYCPYNGKIYVRASNGTTLNSTGLNRVYIFDTTQALANMACGYMEIDEGAVVMGAYLNNYSCYNYLRVNEYES